MKNESTINRWIHFILKREKKSHSVLILGAFFFIVYGFFKNPYFSSALSVLFFLILGLQIFSSAVAWNLIGSFTGGRWRYAHLDFRNFQIQLRWCLPILLIVFVLFFLNPLYKWKLIGGEHGGNLENRALYFSELWVWLRAMLYCGVWWLVGQLALKAQAASWWNGLGLVVLFLSLVGFATDFIMSLQLEWHSALFGPAFAVSALSTGLCWNIHLSRGEQKESIQVRQDIGNLVLMLVLLWGYFHFYQFIIIWSGQLPHEEIWYLPRQTRYLGLTYLVLLTNFLIPFCLLIFRPIKQGANTLQMVALILIFGRIAEFWWWILPSVQSDKSHFALAVGISTGVLTMTLDRMEPKL